MNVNYKKSLKFITLLVSALLIATVSAATYSYMFINGTVTIGTQKIIWIAGPDAPGDIAISGGTVTMDLDVQPGVEQNFTQCLYLKNNETGTAHNLTVTVTSPVSSGTFDLMRIHIYKNETGGAAFDEFVDTLDVTVQNDQYTTYTGNTPLLAQGYYQLTFTVKAKTGTSGSPTFTIEVRYE